MPNILEITDFSDPTLDVYARLTENQLVNRADPNNGLFIAESPNVIDRALDAGYVPVSMLLERKHIEGQAAGIIARCGDVPIYTAPLPVLTQLTGFPLTRGVLCAMRRPPLPSVEAVCAGAKRIAVLENIMNPTNLGAIFRSAAALGMDAVLLTDGCSDPLYRRTLRVSMGTSLQIPWAWAGRSLEDWKQSGLAMLRDRGFRTIAMALREDAVQLDRLCLGEREKAAVILGAEGDGLMPETIGGADSVVVIPMMRGVDSLNVAAASAVVFYELGKK